MLKGYQMPDCYMGYVDGEYIPFESDRAYYEYMKEKEENECSI